MTQTAQGGEPAMEDRPGFADLVRTWGRIGLLSFGGPAAQIALMHRVIVDEKKWLSEQQYLNALSFCMLLPGPEAMQLATYSGWRTHGVVGGLAAGLLFVMPGALVVLGLALIYVLFGQTPLVQALFLGVKAAVLVIVIEALLRISKRALKARVHWLIAALSFVGIFFLGLSFPLIILAAAAAGYLLAASEAGAPASKIGTSLVETANTVKIWLAVWILPLLAVSAVLGFDHVLSQLGWFFSKLAVVTFGGAYAVLAYMGQDVVTQHGWLTAGQMMDGLGLAETTPGPLILVTEFVGFLAAYQHGGGATLLMGVLGALIALWATFAPCFLWIFAGAPYVEWIIAQPKLRGALAGISAAVVGVIINLTLWFGLNVFFGEVEKVEQGLLTFWRPELSSLDWRVILLAAVSGYLLLFRHWAVGIVLAVAGGLAVALSFGLA